MMAAPPKTRQHGYILAMNIAILAMMFVGVSYMGQRMSLAIRLAHAERERITTEYQLESAKARILLLLSTVPRSRKGLGLDDNAVAMDGRPYKLDDDILVTLQDSRGLVALNGAQVGGLGQERIQRLLGTYGIKPDAAARLSDTLLDYRDTDDLKRLNGAEKTEYEQGGLVGQIRNADLLGTGELSRVLGWKETREIWQQEDPITRHVNVQKVTSFNPNTADWRALVAMSRIQEELAKELVKNRRSGQTPDISGIVYGGDLGDPFGPNAFVNLFPGPTVNVTLRKSSLRWGYRLVITHAPDFEPSPWRIESVERIVLPESDTPPQKIARLPEASQLRDLTKPVQVQLPF